MHFRLLEYYCLSRTNFSLFLQNYCYKFLKRLPSCFVQYHLTLIQLLRLMTIKWLSETHCFIGLFQKEIVFPPCWGYIFLDIEHPLPLEITFFPQILACPSGIQTSFTLTTGLFHWYSQQGKKFLYTNSYNLLTLTFFILKDPTKA